MNYMDKRRLEQEQRDRKVQDVRLKLLDWLEEKLEHKTSRGLYEVCQEIVDICK